MSEATKYDGGPAFPCDRVTNALDGSTAQWESGGMSLRDYFAAHAPPLTDKMIAAIVEALVKAIPDASPRLFEREVQKHIAKRNYIYADAMLMERLP